MKSCQVDGGFAPTPGGKADSLTTSSGLLAAAELKIVDKALVDASILYFHEHAKEDEQVRIVDSLAAIAGSATELARQPKKLAKLLTEIRERGFALMDEAYSRDVFDGKVWAMGVPVTDGSKVFASINVMMLHGAVSVEDGVRLYLGPLKATAVKIAEALTENHRATLFTASEAAA